MENCINTNKFKTAEYGKLSIQYKRKADAFRVEKMKNKDF